MKGTAGYAQHRLNALGIDFSWLEWGDVASPPLVLLHGLTGNAHNWDLTAERLAQRFRLFVPDQRGHGDSGHAATYRTQDYVDDLHQLAARWKLDRFDLLGLSMGGHNAMAYAAAHPEQVTRLVVVDIPPKFDLRRTPNWSAMQRAAAEGHSAFNDFEATFAWFRAGNAIAPEENLRHRARWSLRTHADGTLTLKHDPRVATLWEPDDLWQRLPSIAAPTLLVRGGLSAVLPAETASEVAAAIPDCEVAEVADAGHSIHTDRPEALAKVVLDWLGRRG